MKKGKASQLPQQIRGLVYYPLQRNWTRKIIPHLADKELNAVLFRDFSLYSHGRRFLPGTLPGQIDDGEWRCGHRGPQPRYWQYVSHGACHWIVNFALRLARLAEPNYPWRIVTSTKHSTVWDGEKTLFEFNFQAFGIPPARAWEILLSGRHLTMLKPGEQHRAGKPLCPGDASRTRYGRPQPPREQTYKQRGWRRAHGDVLHSGKLP
jgi:hypothetical protein